MSGAIVRARNRVDSVSDTAASTGGNRFGSMMQVAVELSKAGDMIPGCYRGKPGAVLMVMGWADANEVDYFSALQGIYPIDGRPFVSAELRRMLATRKGFEFRVVKSDRSECVLEVWDHRGEQPLLRGAPVVVVIGEIPDYLVKRQNWRQNPDDMLFATAIRKADRRYVQTAASFVDSGQDYDDEGIIDVAGFEEQTASPVSDLGASASTNTKPEPEPDAVDEVVEGEARELKLALDESPVTVDELREAVVAQFGDRGRVLSTAVDIAGDGEVLSWVHEYIEERVRASMGAAEE